MDEKDYLPILATAILSGIIMGAIILGRIIAAVLGIFFPGG